jgi:16S rRNA (guanine966-N2)-methyltransferase
VKITSGLFKGKSISRVGVSTTRETSNLVKQAVFNMLGDISGKSVLDLFSGSGQYSFEAISRGALKAICIDNNKSSIHTIKKNSNKLNCEDNIEVKKIDLFKIKKLVINEKIDITFIDPPYTYNDFNTLISKLPRSEILVIETHKNTHLDEKINVYSIIKSKIYGIKKISIYKFLLFS